MTLRRRFRRPSHTTVVAYLGLFVALGGTSAYAANEWTGSNVVDGSLTGQDVFDNTISGKDITNNSVAGADLSDGSVSGVDVNDFTIRGNDIGFNTITGDNILDGSLEVRDVAKASFAHFNATVGVVPARDCTVHPINGVGSQGDHLLLTPNTEWGRIIYSVTYSSDNTAWLQACNMFSQSINAGTGRFNLLVIDKG